VCTFLELTTDYFWFKVNSKNDCMGMRRTRTVDDGSLLNRHTVWLCVTSRWLNRHTCVVACYLQVVQQTYLCGCMLPPGGWTDIPEWLHVTSRWLNRHTCVVACVTSRWLEQTYLRGCMLPPGGWTDIPAWLHVTFRWLNRYTCVVACNLQVVEQTYLCGCM